MLERHRRVALARVAGLTLDQAAIYGGFRGTKAAMATSAYRVLKKAEVRAYTEELMAEVEKNVAMSRERARQILASIAEEAEKDSDRINALKTLYPDLSEEKPQPVQLINPGGTPGAIEDVEQGLRLRSVK